MGIIKKILPRGFRPVGIITSGQSLFLCGVGGANISSKSSVDCFGVVGPDSGHSTVNRVGRRLGSDSGRQSGSTVNRVRCSGSTSSAPLFCGVDGANISNISAADCFGVVGGANASNKSSVDCVGLACSSSELLSSSAGLVFLGRLSVGFDSFACLLSRLSFIDLCPDEGDGS